MGFLTQRTITPEWMDSSEISPIDLAREAAFIRTVNRRWGGVKAVLGHLNKWSRHWPRLGLGTPERPVTFIDLATGSADIPLAIVQWAKQRQCHVRITAVDLNPAMLAIAREHVSSSESENQEPWISLLAADSNKLPFGKASFDYALASLFLHHLPDIEVMTTLKIMEDLSRRGMIWNDLLRHRLAHWVVKGMTCRSSEVIRHDAVVSVAAGFTRAEVLAFRQRLGLHQLAYKRHWAMRFTLAGEHGSNAPGNG